MFIHEDLLDSQPNDFDSLTPGDKASSKANYIWLVEKLWRGQWVPAPVHNTPGGLQHTTRSSREQARHVARELRMMGHEVRIVPYKACLDTRGRHNRQVTSERLDA